jgi:hypothetical protein
MTDVEPIEFSIRRKVHASLTLDVKDYARGVETGLPARCGGKPVWDGVRSDGGGQDFGNVSYLLDEPDYTTSLYDAQAWLGQITRGHCAVFDEEDSLESTFRSAD